MKVIRCVCGIHTVDRFVKFDEQKILSQATSDERASQRGASLRRWTGILTDTRKVSINSARENTSVFIEFFAIQTFCKFRCLISKQILNAFFEGERKILQIYAKSSEALAESKMFDANSCKVWLTIFIFIFFLSFQISQTFFSIFQSSTLCRANTHGERFTCFSIFQTLLTNSLSNFCQFVTRTAIVRNGITRAPRNSHCRTDHSK